MAFIKNNLQLENLYNPDLSPSTYTNWATNFATNIATYFSTGTIISLTVGSYIYNCTIASGAMASLPALTSNLINLYNTNTTKTDSEWGKSLATTICNYIDTINFIGTKQMTSLPFTVETWSGVVNSSLAKPGLISSLTPIYLSSFIPNVSPLDRNTFILTEETAIDVAAKLCYCEIPALLLS